MHHPTFLLPPQNLTRILPSLLYIYISLSHQSSLPPLLLPQRRDSSPPRQQPSSPPPPEQPSTARPRRVQRVILPGGARRLRTERAMAMEPLPLGFGDAMDTTLFSTLWSFQEELQPQESLEELKQSLAAATMELEVSREELRRKEQSIARLADLVRQVAKERDEARDQVQQLLLAAAKQAAAPVHQPASVPPAAALGTSSVTDSDCSLVSSPVDPFFDPVTSSDRRRCGAASPPPPAKQPQQQQMCGADAVLDMLAAKKQLPPRGRLLQSVMEAGPLLQNLLVAGPLPRWRNPPPVHPLDTLPVGGGGVYVGAAPLHNVGATPQHNAGAALGYAPNANNACMKRPMAAMPAMPMAATSCSQGFVAKRHRLH